MPEQITESVAIAEAESIGNGRYRVLCISEGKGSSGFYPRETLIEAASKKLIGRSTFAYLDHPSATEAHDRPERSVRDLAGVFTSDAVWSEEHKGLVAEMQVFAPYRELVSEMAGHIGLSIRGDGEIEMREGQRTITSLAHIESVDFVTRAGRGGRVLQLLESARPGTVNARAVAHGVAEATANELREQLQDALKAAFGAEDTYVWVRDFDDTNVWFDLDTPGESATWQQPYELSGNTAVFTGPPMKVIPQTRYVPVDPAGGSTTTTSTEESLMPQIEEAEHGRLVEAAGRVPTLEAERDQHKSRADIAEAALADANARTAARPTVAAKVAESKTLGGRTQARLVESIVGSLPVVDGKVADEQLTTAVESAVKTAEAEVADYQRPVTQSVFGSFGSVAESEAGGEQLNEADVLASIRKPFGQKTGA